MMCDYHYVGQKFTVQVEVEQHFFDIVKDKIF